MEELDPPRNIRDWATGFGGSYRDVDGAEDSSGAAAWLDELSGWTFFREYKRRSLELMELAPGMRVLDVGCGPGDMVRNVDAMVGHGGTAVGIDRSQVMIGEARRRAVAEGVKPLLVRAGAHHLPFGDASFDAVRADRILQHLPEPDKAVAELARVAAPGGRVLTVDPDQDTLAIDVEPPEIAEKIKAYRRDCEFPSGAIAHRMPMLFRQAGLDGIQVETATLTLDDPERCFGLPEWGRRAYELGLLDEHEIETWERNLRRAVATGRFRFSITFFTTVGVRPPPAAR